MTGEPAHVSIHLGGVSAIGVTDPAVFICRATEAPNEPELVTRRWSWPGPTGKPVYNFRSDGRVLDHGRCLIPIDAFYEFTDGPHSGAGKKPPKSKWRFTMTGLDWFCVAGVWRSDPKVGQAWTLLTTRPGSDIAPYHDRQIVLLRPDQWRAWLDPAAPAGELCKPLPAGSLEMEQIR